MRICLFLCLSFLSAPLLANTPRVTLSLDGVWQIEESKSADEPPQSYRHTVVVPGLVNLAKPGFKDVDLFDSKELISNRIRSGKLPESSRVDGAGVPRQDRNYFWYRRQFSAPSGKSQAFLTINKAQFGTAVWVNGQKIGEYAGCFSASYFDLSRAVDWNDSNELVVRIGAHPAVLPDNYPAGTDFEKLKWTPGIYDSVSIHFCDNPVIETVQVAPRIETSEIVVQTRIRNHGATTAFELKQQVTPWKRTTSPVQGEPLRLKLAAGEEKLVTRTIRIPGAHLWSPEDPFLYVLESSTGGDSVRTRFGMREFRGDSSTGRFYLNGKPYFLRGSNITLHRFFEDPDCGDLPWDETWVRKLLVEIPKKMNWNSFRFCIGPVPDQWLEIADEAGLLIQNEFFIWTGAPEWDRKYSRHYDLPELIRQYRDWMRDGWNHPSVAIWDANNESKDPIFGEKIIPAVRGLDLSNRPWENSYNPPVGPDDPVEHHPYLYYSTATGEGIQFRMTDLESRDPQANIPPLAEGGHPVVINEYAWLWLNRDGTPTLLTDKLYPKLLGPDSTTKQRFALYNYLLAAKTEYWRSTRQFAGILHFVYLTCSYPGVFTSDHFIDVKQLELEPHFSDYVREAFKPLGLYLKFFQPELKAGMSRDFTVVLINDEAAAARGNLTLRLERHDGEELATVTRPFSVPEFGEQTIEISLAAPASGAGECVLRATAQTDANSEPTTSRRWVKIVR
jgi:beta-galactosidase